MQTAQPIPQPFVPLELTQTEPLGQSESALQPRVVNGPLAQIGALPLQRVSVIVPVHPGVPVVGEAMHCPALVTPPETEHVVLQDCPQAKVAPEHVAYEVEATAISMNTAAKPARNFFILIPFPSWFT